MAQKNIVILISGSGSNLQAIIDATEKSNGEAFVDANIAAVISNRPEVFGLKRAKNANIPSHVIEHTAFPDREQFDLQLMQCIDQYKPDLIVLAGFLRILTAPFVKHYQGRILNIHPSLLPLYPGLNTHQRAIDAGDTLHGATVHFVTPDLDSGPLIIQASVNINANDMSELAHQVLSQEHQIYPLAIKWFIEDRLILGQNGAELDGEVLNKPIQFKKT